MTLTIKLDFKSKSASHSLGHFRLSVTDAKMPHETGTPPNILAILKTPAETSQRQQQNELTTYFRDASPGKSPPPTGLAKLRSDRAAYDAQIPTVMVMEEMPKPRDRTSSSAASTTSRAKRSTAGVPRLFRAAAPTATR